MKPLLHALVLVAALAAPALAKPHHYVCPPCGAPCDARVFDAPGVCPACGMTLVDQDSLAEAQAAKPARLRVAMLLFDGVEIIDYTGPWEVFGGADFDVYSVAATRAPITTAMGMTVVPRYTFADAPAPDVLLIPGGSVRATEHDAATLAWIRRTHEHTRVTMSVCNGAFILASTGLLDGKSATTTYSNIDKLREAFPQVHVVDDARVVDQGRIVTTAGLSAGIDGALHVVSRLVGDGDARQVALGIEYDWHPDAPFRRALLADRWVPRIDIPRVKHWHIASTEGDHDHWDYVLQVAAAGDAAGLLNDIDGELVTHGKWSRVEDGHADGTAPATSRWRFADAAGAPWTGKVSVESVPGESGQYLARLSIARQR